MSHDSESDVGAKPPVVSYSIDLERRLVTTQASGVVTSRILDQVRDELRNDPAFDPTYDQLFDLSGAIDIEIPAPVMEYVASVSAFRPGVRRAFVGVTDLQFGVARMFGTMAERHGHTVQVFRDLAAAHAWLSSSPPGH